MHRKATDDSGDNQAMRAKFEPAETALANRANEEQEKEREGKRTYSEFERGTQMLQTHHNRWTHNHKKERETSGHKRRGRKISLTEKCDNTEKDLSK